ncbi:MAG: aminopeptidase P family protein [Prevotellaceae bacterium]|jgi:Xaa-Pro aminopeptidase|nr:aminopeptidase P family protein [Prevotellaceae bacterium]
MNYVRDRLENLYTELKNRGVDAIIIPSNDPHFSEYPAECWQYRKWISGFNGSAGSLTVRLSPPSLQERGKVSLREGEAALWVDSRYFIQAKKQLEDTDIEMQKLFSGDGLFDESWLKKCIKNDGKVGVDSKLFSVKMFKSLKQSLLPLILTDIGDVFDVIYPDRPALPESDAFLLPDEVTGKSRREKLADFAKSTTPNGEIYIVSTLDEIAWILNMRGSDVAYNPVVISYLIIDYPNAHLFTNAKLTENDRKQLSDDAITIHPYNDFNLFVSSIDKNRTVKLNFDKTNFHTYKLLKNITVIIEEKNISETIAFRKAIKNKVELSGFRSCMVTDGIAMFRFCKWLNDNVGKIRITEIEAAEKLEIFRKSGKDYRGLSFGTISAYGANGALPHYSPSNESNAEIGANAFYLVDSGAQYLTGTTDLTRTLHFGNPTDEEKEDYTLVLKGMINLSMAVFPAGTRGAQLDILARKFLWEKSKNFLHGTGHGVGHYLNVHEGPQSIRQEENPVTLFPGMVISNEPAIYIEGKYGIRTENLIACKFHNTTAFGDFYTFETLTICPIETKAINVSMMSKEEIKWLNDYHKRVYDSLSPYLEKEEVEYLKTITAAL